jgi:hypothetical protein
MLQLIKVPFNLEALTGLAQVGEKVGVDLWHYESPNGGSLEKGIQLMADYNDPGKEWPYAQIDEIRRVERMAPIFLKAGLALDNDEFVDLAISADFDSFTVESDLAEIWAERDIELLYPRR